MYTTAVTAVARFEPTGRMGLGCSGSGSTIRGKQAHQRFIWDDQSGSTDSETSPL